MYSNTQTLYQVPQETEKYWRIPNYASDPINKFIRYFCKGWLPGVEKHIEKERDKL